MYSCDVCTKAFARSWELLRHLQTTRHLEKQQAHTTKNGIPTNIGMASEDFHGSVSNNSNDSKHSQVKDADSDSMDELSHHSNSCDEESSDFPIDLPYEIEQADCEDSLYCDWESDLKQFPDYQDSNSWFPFSSKNELILATLLSYPERPSKGFLSFLWKMMKCLGVRDLPSLHQLQKKVDSLPAQFVTEEAETPSGSIFHYIRPSSIIASLFSTPEIRKSMMLYPNHSLETFTCIFQGKKMDNFDLQTPMINLGGLRIFQNDLVKVFLKNGSFFHFIVRGFFYREGSLHLKSFLYCLRSRTVDASTYVEICTDAHIVEVIEEPIGIIRKVSPQKDDLQLQLNRYHPLRNQNVDVFNIPFTFFSDDTSANISKKWNKVDVVYLRLCST